MTGSSLTRLLRSGKNLNTGGSASFQKEWVEETRRAVTVEVNRLLRKRGGSRKALTLIAERINETQKSKQATDQLYCFEYALAWLKVYAQDGQASRSEMQSIINIAQTVLITSGVTPKSSRLSNLYTDLFNASARADLVEGSSLKGAWLQQFGRHFRDPTSKGLEIDSLLAMADIALRLGHARRARLGYELAEARADSQSVWRCFLGRLASLRLAGREAEAILFADQSLSLGTADPLGANVRQAIEWERLKSGVQKSLDLKALLQYLGGLDIEDHPQSFLEAFLMSRGCASTTFMEELSSVATMRRRIGKLERGSPLYRLFECCTVIERAYESERNLAARIEAVGNCLESRSRLPSVDTELLYLAAASRWLIRVKQPLFADICVSEYETLSMKLTGCEDSDVLGMLSDIRGMTLHPLQDIRVKKLKRRLAGKSGDIVRIQEDLTDTMAVTRLAMDLAQRGVLENHLIDESNDGIVNLDQDDLQRQEVIENLQSGIKPMIFTSLVASVLNGPLRTMMEESFQILQVKTKVLSPEQVRQAVNCETGSEIEQNFVDFEMQPIAQTALAQFHIARLIDGRQVTVKVRHPQSMLLLQLEAWAVHAVARELSSRFPGVDRRAVAAGLFRRLGECLDLERECQHISQLQRALKKDRDYCLPEVVGELTTVGLSVFVASQSDLDEGRTIKRNFFINRQSPRLCRLLVEAVLMRRIMFLNADTFIQTVSAATPSPDVAGIMFLSSEQVGFAKDLLIDLAIAGRVRLQAADGIASADQLLIWDALLHVYDYIVKSVGGTEARRLLRETLSAMDVLQKGQSNEQRREVDGLFPTGTEF